MSSLPWFRLYRELKDDPKIGELDDASFRVFIESLCWACEKGDGGRTGLTEENANWAFRRNVTPALHTLFQKRLLSKSPTGEIMVPKWDERQKRSDSSAERVRKFRERNSVTLHETLPKRRRNGGEERRGDKNRIYSAASRVALVYLREKTGTQFRETDSNLKIIDARLQELGVDIEGVKKMIDRQVLKWKGTDMQDYLRPETLFGKTKFDGYYAAREQPVKNESNQSNHTQRVDRSIGTANEGTASQYRGLGRVAKT